MKFRFYDILSHLIPGVAIYMVFLNATGVTFTKDDIFAATVVGFIIGYFVNTISSWLEDFYYWTWRGKPSTRLLEGKGVWKIEFYAWNEAKKKLSIESSEENPSNDALFQIAMRYIDGEGRVADFNVNYAFSRVMLTTILMASIILMISYWSNYYVVSGLLSLTFIAWLRAKQRGYYFAREVLSNYLKSTSNYKAE